MAEVRTTSTTGGQKGTKLQRFDLLPTGPLTDEAEHYAFGLVEGFLSAIPEAVSELIEQAVEANEEAHSG